MNPFVMLLKGMEDIETKMAYINRQGFTFTADELEMAEHTGA